MVLMLKYFCRCPKTFRQPDLASVQIVYALLNALEGDVGVFFYFHMPSCLLILLK